MEASYSNLELLLPYRALYTWSVLLSRIPTQPNTMPAALELPLLARWSALVANAVEERTAFMNLTASLRLFELCTPATAPAERPLLAALDAQPVVAGAVAAALGLQYTPPAVRASHQASPFAAFPPSKPGCCAGCCSATTRLQDERAMGA